MKKIMYFMALLVIVCTVYADTKITVPVPAEKNYNYNYQAYAKWNIEGLGDISCAEDEGSALQKEYTLTKGSAVTFICTTPVTFTEVYIKGTITLNPTEPLDEDDCIQPVPFLYITEGDIEILDIWERDNTYNRATILGEILTYIPVERREDLIIMAVEDDGVVKGTIKVAVDDTIRSMAMWKVRAVDDDWVRGDTITEGAFPSSGDEVDFDFTPQAGKHIDIESIFNIPPHGTYKAIKHYCIEVGLDTNSNGHLEDMEVVGVWKEPWKDVFTRRINEGLDTENIKIINAITNEDIDDVKDAVNTLVNTFDVVSDFAAYSLNRFFGFTFAPPDSDFNPTISSATVQYTYNHLDYPVGADFGSGNNVDKLTYDPSSKPALKIYDSATLADAIDSVLDKNAPVILNHFISSSADYSFTDSVDGVIDFHRHKLLDRYLFVAMGNTSEDSQITLDVVVEKVGSEIKVKSIHLHGNIIDLYDWKPNDTPLPVQLQWNPGKGSYGKIFFNNVELDHTYTLWDYDFD